MQFRTRSIHVGNEKCPETGAVVRPLHLASTYVQPGAGKWGPFDYSRSGNPTRQSLEKTLTSLEGGCGALAFASGMAATHSVMAMLHHGDHIVAGSDIYGGTYRLLHKVTNRAGIDVTLVDTTTADNLSKAMTPATKWVWIESPGNPRLSITDIRACAEVAHQHGALLGVDSTFASPVLTRPLELGADLVMHSATKYLGGHSDVIMGAVITSDAKLAEKLYFLQNAVGAIPGPQDCFLMLRGIKTLHLRVERSCKNARKIAKYLSNHPKVDKVYYPGLKSHPQHELAKRQMKDAGGMVSFDFAGGTFDMANKVLTNTHFFTLAESLGGVESLIGHPASMTHASIPKEDRLKVGLTDSLIRLSIGIEDVDDLMAKISDILNKKFEAVLR